ncbi:MAG: hypothetical protein VW268_04375 [Rhodospirillaceae bacterium]
MIAERRRPLVFQYAVDYPARRRRPETVLRLPLSNDGVAVTGIVSVQDLSSDDIVWTDQANPGWQLIEPAMAGC